MKHKHYIHLAYYLLLFVFLGLGLMFFYQNIGIPGAQYRIAVLTASGYFLWGMLFHAAKGDLHGKIVVEYLLIALLSVLLIRGVMM